MLLFLVQVTMSNYLNHRPACLKKKAEGMLSLPLEQNLVMSHIPPLWQKKAILKENEEVAEKFTKAIYRAQQWVN